MKRIEAIRISGLNKLTYLLKVLDSCTTGEQIQNVHKWGSMIIENHYDYSGGNHSFKESYKMRGMYYLSTSIFKSRVSLKIDSL